MKWAGWIVLLENFSLQEVLSSKKAIHALHEEPIADPSVLVDVVLWDSDHTSDLDQISYDDGAASDLDEQVIADPTPSPVWAQQTLQATGDLVGDLADTLKTRS